MFPPISETLDEIAKTGVSRYATLIGMLNNAHSAIIMLADPQMPSVRREHMRQVGELVNNWLDLEDEAIEQKVSEVAFLSVTDARDALGALDDRYPTLDALSDHLIDVQTHLQGEVRAQVQRDLVSFNRRQRRFLLEVDTLMKATRLDRPAALVRQRINETKRAEQTMFRDRRGRQSSSDGFIAGTWRQTLLWLYNDVYLNEAARLGAGSVSVVYPPDSKHKEIELKFVEGFGAPTYAEIRDEIFHPNSTARLVAKK